MSDHLPPAPEPSAVDYFAGLIKAGVSAIPDWGSPAAEIFGMITAPILGRRREQWFEDLRGRLNDLMGKVDGLTVKSLTDNEEFVSALAHATQTALKTHQAEKRESLRNAVLNVAVGSAPSEDLQMIFLNMIDRFSPKHMQVLIFFTDRKPVTLQTLREQRNVTDQVVIDLNTSGLIKDSRPYEARGRETAEALVICDWKVSDLGAQFLKFIQSPNAEKR
jgi:hypothetical protein